MLLLHKFVIENFKKVITYLIVNKMKHLFTKENGVKFVVTFAAVLAGLALHQVYVAKHLAPKAKA